MPEPWSDPTHDVLADLDAVWRTRTIEAASAPPWLTLTPRPRVPQFPVPYPLSPIEAAVKRILAEHAARLWPLPDALEIDWAGWGIDPLADVRAELQRFLDDYYLGSEITA